MGRVTIPWHTIRHRDPYADLHGEPTEMSEYRSHAHPHSRADHHLRIVGARPCLPGGACRRGLIAHVHRVSDLERQVEREGPEGSVRAILRSPSYAILSAENPSGKRLSAEENSVRTRELAENLISAGYAVHPAVGVYVYREGDAAGQTTRERSFVVESINKHAARAIADRFGQESLIYGGELLNARNGNRLERFARSRTIFGSEATQRASYTVVRIGGREIAFALQP